MQQQHDRAASVRTVLRWVRSLQHHRETRDATGHFWIEGIRQFVHACDAGWEFDTIVVSRVLLKSGLSDRLARGLARSGVRRICVTPEQFRSVSSTERASGIGAILRQRWTRIHQLDPNRGLCWLVVERLRSPGNLGTILRTAEAVGAGGFIFLSGSSDPFDSAVVRVSMGGIFRLEFARATHDQLGHWARANSVSLIGLSPARPDLWTHIPIARPLALLIGDERSGLSPQASALSTASARLPMTGAADSLNVGVAAGVMLYELVRRNLYPCQISKESSKIALDIC